MASLLSAIKAGFVTEIDAVSTVYGGFGPGTERPRRYTQIIPSGGSALDYAPGQLFDCAFQVNYIGPAESIDPSLAAAEAARDKLHRLARWSLTGYLVELVECTAVAVLAGPDGQAKCTFGMTVAGRVVPINTP